MEYLWEADVSAPHFNSLTENVSTDVLVVGGGMAGVLCAALLRERGVDCLLAEAKTIGSGVTKGTTAVLSAQHDTLYTDLIKRFGTQKAAQYLDANRNAVNRFRQLAEKIPCDFEEKASYMYSRTDSNALSREAETVNRLGFPAEFTTQTNLPFPVAGAVRYPGMAQFHPLKFLYGAAGGLKIFENTFIHRIADSIAYTNSGKISARKIIIATHFPFIDRRGLYFMKLYQMRSFVVALENAPDLDGTYVDTAESGMYFRNYKGLLLVGGGDHRTGKPGGGFEAVRTFCRRYFPEAREKYTWATQDCMSLDGVPYIGTYSPATPDLYVATGFNEWGMTSSMVAAVILADMVTGHEYAFSNIFSPDRSMLRTQLFANMGATISDFIIPTTKRCSHLGCALRWNSAEHTWDCPCHGSRFNEHGTLIDNPATKDVSL
ncbi:MAG: FAD-dependent oxidoreductase [Oscillospiraceae bacterium]